MTSIRYRVPSVSIVSPAPSWASALTVNAWTQLANTNVFTDVQASNVGQYASIGPTGVFRAWGSAAYLPGFGSYGSMLHWNGGHNDYFGSEVYSFDLGSLTWARLTSPSSGPYPPNEADGIYSDGIPVVPHNYNYVGARTANDTFWSMSKERTNGGDVTTIGTPCIFNPSTLTWFNSTQAKPIAGGGVGTSTACYDATRDGVWLVDCTNGDFAFYTFSTDSWTPYLNSFSYGQSIIVHAPTKDCLLLFQNSAAQIRGFDCASPTTAPVTLTVSGTAPLATWQNTFSIKWSAVLGKFFFYRTGGGAAVFTLTPPTGDWRTGTWTWAQLSVTSAPVAPTGEGGGVYSKFQVAEWGSVVVGILNNRYQGPCQAIRFQ